MTIEISKSTFSRFLGSDCLKQLRLMIDRQPGMPPEQPPRPGLNAIKAAGREWESRCITEIDQAMPNALLGDRVGKGGPGTRFKASPLRNHLDTASVGQILVECQFAASQTFLDEFKVQPLIATHALDMKELRPDLIFVMAPGTPGHEISTDGTIHPIPGNDLRKQLRVADIKLSEKPGTGHLAEVVLYSLVLASWLNDHGYASDWVVRADPAVWPGTHEVSHVAATLNDAADAAVQPLASDVLAAIFEDLETAPAQVFTARIRRFFAHDIPAAMAQPWHDLPYHVAPQCRSCDFLGQYWGPGNAGDPLHCLPTAKREGALSQVPFINRGAVRLLHAKGKTFSEIAMLDPQDPVLNEHHTLRGQRTVIPVRAASVQDGTNQGVAHNAGTSSVLPKFATLNVYLTADFDNSTALTFAFGISAYWGPPRSWGQPPRSWHPAPLLVTQKSLAVERRVLVQFLNEIAKILDEVRAEDARLGKTSSVQFYMWDELTYFHLTRIVGRHLSSIMKERAGVRLLSWLFPPEQIVGSAAFVSEPLITFVGDAVRALLALEVPFYYSLMETARRYHPEDLDEKTAKFYVHPLYEDPFSDQIPSERAHDLWRGDSSFASHVSNLAEAVRKRLRAVEEITKRLRNDLRADLMRWAPKITNVRVPPNESRLTADEQLIYAFARLNAAVSDQKIARSRAMPTHEREARFLSVLLEARLQEDERGKALDDLGISQARDSIVYRVSPESAEAGFREDDFMCAVLPADRPDIAEMTIGALCNERGLDPAPYGDKQYRVTIGDVMKVRIIKFDRQARLLVLEPNSWTQLERDRAIRDGLVSWDPGPLSLEKVQGEFFTKKLLETLKAISRTPKAIDNPISVRALGGSAPNPRRNQNDVPVEDVIWDARRMAATAVSRDQEGARRALQGIGSADLNDSQWAAYRHALLHRLSLIWGPPGTGKSKTLSQIVAAACWDAVASERTLRVLVTANTYTAVANVLEPIAELVTQLTPSVKMYHPARSGRSLGNGDITDFEPKQDIQTQNVLAGRLDANSGDVTIVGAIPLQLHKMAADLGSAATPLFDLIVVDEASQLDVGTALLSLATLAPEGAVIVAGDPLQLPPIRQIEPPKGAETLVGSLYEFLAEGGVHRLGAQELLVNYRSNEEIVAVAREAGYPVGLTAHNSDLRLAFAQPLPDQKPADWPLDIRWDDGLIYLADPQMPVSCVVYDDGLAGQSNDFESDVVTGLVKLLGDRMAASLATTSNDPTVLGRMSAEDFFGRGIGIVTPHRAQQSKIMTALMAAFPDVDPLAIRSAVDTVERFQGQERDVIIASYAVGDPDTVAQEDEFLQSLNRFNVMTSRPRAKLVVLASQELIQHLSGDLEVLRASGMLKSFAENLCRQSKTVTLFGREVELRYP